ALAPRRPRIQPRLLAGGEAVGARAADERLDRALERLEPRDHRLVVRIQIERVLLDHRGGRIRARAAGEHEPKERAHQWAPRTAFSDASSSPPDGGSASAVGAPICAGSGPGCTPVRPSVPMTVITVPLEVSTWRTRSVSESATNRSPTPSSASWVG